jgi:glucan phosphoethanolaminetransferase (alkaline phosphatase superfamily)
MRVGPLAGTSFLLIAGYLAFKWSLAGQINEERLVAFGGMYHWSALTMLAVGWSVWLVRTRAWTGSFWGDFKTLAKPLVVYALLAALSVWSWNHVFAAESTELRKALRLAQIDSVTETEAAFSEFLAQQDSENMQRVSDRMTYREQARDQVEWMLSGGVTLVLSMLTYLFAAVVLALCAVFLLHHIWGLSTLR